MVHCGLKLFDQGSGSFVDVGTIVSFLAPGFWLCGSFAVGFVRLLWSI